MSSKWADYLIPRVCYNGVHTHIDKVEIREDFGDKLGPKGVWQRTDVISSIKSGHTFVTAPPNDEGKLTKGASVRIVKVNNAEYLRTDGNSTASDNLGNLPEFSC